MRLTDEGMVPQVRYLPSPNCDARDAGVSVDLLVIHNISLPPGEFGGSGILDLFLNRIDPAAHPYYADIAALRVSAHFLIRRDGEIIQFVPCSMRAWHAGVSNWCGREHCNDFSIGVELEGTDITPFTDAQYAQLAALTRVLRARYHIADIAGHADIAPSRKTDPGPCFDWQRFRASI